MCDKYGWKLREERPDILPYDHLTPLEMELWSLYYKDLKKRNG